VAGGIAPISTLRMIPPPNAVITPRASTPTMSSRATGTAVSAPLSPKANVPTRSNTSNTGGSVTGAVYRSVVPCRSEAPGVWVPEMLCTSCDLLVLVDQASESGPPPDAVRLASRELGERS
jgi:hypothetical protein